MIELEPLLDVEPPVAAPATPRATVAIKAARAKLSDAKAPPPVWPLLAAAGLFAAAALSLAVAVIAGPPSISPDATHVSKAGVYPQRV